MDNRVGGSGVLHLLLRIIYYLIEGNHVEKTQFSTFCRWRSWLRTNVIVSTLHKSSEWPSIETIVLFRTQQLRTLCTLPLGVDSEMALLQVKPWGNPDQSADQWPLISWSQPTLCNLVSATSPGQFSLWWVFPDACEGGLVLILVENSLVLSCTRQTLLCFWSHVVDADDKFDSLF